MTVDKLAEMLDCTAFRPDTTLADLKECCETAIRFKTASVCVRTCDVMEATKLLRGSKIPVTAMINFPHGGSDTVIKVAEAQKAIEDGAEELELVINIGRLLSDRMEQVEQDIKALHMVAYRKGVLLKVILETCYLPEKYKRMACRMVGRVGAAYVCNATGYGTETVTPEEIRLLVEYTPEPVKIKAAGGVRTLDQVLALIEAGAHRVGTGNARAILEEAAIRQKEGLAPLSAIHGL